MQRQRRILSIKWYDHVMNTEVASLTGLEPISTILSTRRSSLFGHVVRLASCADIPANRALSLAVSIGKPRSGPFAILEATQRSSLETLADATQSGWFHNQRTLGCCGCQGSYSTGTAVHSCQAFLMMMMNEQSQLNSLLTNDHIRVKNR